MIGKGASARSHPSESVTLLTLGGTTTACREDKSAEQISIPNSVCLIAVGNGLIIHLVYDKLQVVNEEYNRGASLCHVYMITYTF